MKLLINQFINKLLRLCKSTKTRLYLSSRYWWLAASSGLKLLPGNILRVHQVIPIGRAASQIRTLRTAIKTGLVLVLLITPVISFSYTFFDPHFLARPDWYFYSPYYYFNALDDYIAGATLCLGAFLLFSRHNQFRWVVAAPFAYYLSQVVFKSFATSNDTFNSNIPFSVLILCVFIAITILVSTDRLAHRRNHGRAITVRKNLEGIWNIPDKYLALEEKVELSRKLAKEAGVGNELF